MARAPRKLGLTGDRLNRVLESMRECRGSLLELHGAYPHRSAPYREAEHIVRELDGLALLLTGKENYFLSNWHSTPGSKT